MSAPAVEAPAQAKQQPKQPVRAGASMSTKQMAKAAVDGRKISFPGLGVEGYLVGSDDFHWLIACVERNLTADTAEVETALVHKSASVVRFSPKHALRSEPQAIRDTVDAIGSGFLSFCRRSVLGHHA